MQSKSVTGMPLTWQAALKVATETYGGAGEELAALRMEAEVLRNPTLRVFVVVVIFSLVFTFHVTIYC